VFDREVGVFAADDHGHGGADSVGGLELFAEFGGGEGEVGAVSGGAELLDGGQCIGAAGFIGDDNKNIGRGLSLQPSVHAHFGFPALLDEVEDNDVAHGESNGREIDFPKNNKGADLMCQSPCKVDFKSLRELYVQSTWKEKKDEG
jgi:hypothetical protein